ncbi:enoyl-CoA hydratase/isomerase family protein [Nocardia panacis]|uniref:3-hydroxyisobutyryl-CoA hydrolase n=1 Tax=Nocardia panacis TaxID=2340916 RepID=A0A3A4JYP5_9NOCA|nr:enoyl-CoA hydratase/isomerase family protein [Nocardia panacis]RJO72323.1 enoyl-CoA hydratase/isomerase family protein [Nocardia panacis]
MTEPEVLIERRDGLGLITLNRPGAINALNHPMTLAITRALREWAEDDAVRTVALIGAGERGLCAGGDIVAIHADASGADLAHPAQTPTGRFWREEYLLNALIARYPKPYVVVMDGIVMGGGVGLSGHGSHRIVTERSKVGMPEVGIGFVPDVGGTYLLSRAPGELGTHVGLTTARMTAGDAIAAGFADYFVTAEHIPALLDTLRTESADVAVAKFATTAPESALSAARSWIDDCYGADSVEQIVDRLRASAEPAANAAAAEILTKSPVALKVTLRALRAARGLPALESALNQEYRISLAALASHDLVEGIRAQVIDKDRDPKWSPAGLAEVSAAQVDAYFAELGSDELGLVAPEVQQ